MRCPRCNIDVPDGFTACTLCRTPLQSGDGVDDQPAPGGSLSARLGAGARTGSVPATHRSVSVARESPQRSMPAVPAEALAAGPRRVLPPSAAPPVARRGLPTDPRRREAEPAPARSDEGSRRGASVRGPGPEAQLTGPSAGPLPGASPFAAAPSLSVDSSASQAEVGTRLLSVDPQADRGTRLVEMPVPGVVKRAVRRKEMDRPRQRDQDGEPANPLDDAFASARLLYARMHRFDRWTVWVLLWCFVAVFLPWTYERGIGLVSGIESYGAASAVAVALAALCLWRRTVRWRGTGVFLVLQLLLMAAICAVPVYWLVVGVQVKMSWGMFATLAGGGAGVALTLARLVRVNV